ncbi:MAG: hypothetical protein WAU70_01885 [Flavobacteriales bacterium]
MGLLLSWRHCRLTHTLVKTKNISRIDTPDRTEFDVIENAPLIGVSRQLYKRPHWQWDLFLSFEGRFTYNARIHWSYTSSYEDSDVIQIPARMAFRLGLRCSRKLSPKLGLFLEPHVVLVPQSRFDYVRLEDRSGDKVFVGETRTIMGLDLGLEFGPLFKRAPAHDALN